VLGFLSGGSSDLAVRDIQHKLLPHPLSPFLKPLGMAGGAEPTGALGKVEKEFSTTAPATNPGKPALGIGAFAEENLMANHFLGYVEHFGKLPPSVTGDTKYGTLENRELSEELKVRASYKRRGRSPKTVKAQDRWFKKKQRGRNWIEGCIGNGKEHYRLDRVRYSIKDGSEIWVRAEILAMNLKSAMNRA